MPHPIAGVDDVRPPERQPAALVNGLTADQIAAVRHGPGPLLILAGPGTGKTRTLTHRIAHLLATEQAVPREILAVTFSVRAAGELRLRLADLLGQRTARGVLAATFHSVCARLLRQHAELFGRTETYTIYDQGDLRRVIETLLCDHRQSDLQAAIAACGQPSAAELEHALALAKSRLLTPERYLATAPTPAAPVIAAAWRAVDAELERANAWAFDDLLVAAVRLLHEHPARLAHLRGRWRWLLVDEMQDTNEAQATLVQLLAGAHGNVTVVGDANQAIYGFRCAEPRNILAFGERYPDHEQIALTHNFRSRAEILDVAGACMAQNTRRHATDLLAVRGRGGRVSTRGFALDRDEADWAAVVVADALAAGTPPHEILVLARTGYATAPVQAALAAAGIPHRVLGSLGLYERAEVRDALAHLTLLANPADAQAYRRAVQSPRRGIGTATLAHLVTGARERFAGDLITASVRAHELGALRSAAIREKLIAFGSGLQAVRDQYRAGRSLGHVVAAALMIDGGLVAHHEARRDRSPRPDQRRDSERVLEDLRSLCRAAQTFAEQIGSGASLTGFLEHAAGLHAQELAPGEDRRITVSTIHRAKGTEAQLVIVLGCEEALLPSWRALDSPDPDELEEERRLFYVAATRAKERLVLTRCHVRGGRRTGGPSRFLTEAGLVPGPMRLAA